MRFSTVVEPPEPMRGLEIPAEIIDIFDSGKRPRVTVTLNGHSWHTRVAIMRGRFLIGLSNANRKAAGVAIGDQVSVSLEREAVPQAVTEPEELSRALDSDPETRAAFNALSHSRRRALVHEITSAKRAETRQRRIASALAALRSPR
ncbi:YdeI/OmpD-associated family protein [Gryllotalpicola koreensis]|uniref:DUF1905 domain-containing protein n=1 Tax=Gryllotalpicola koreensis TaxID=993086 RepID=A0ABP7ZQD0_9MICO